MSEATRHPLASALAPDRVRWELPTTGIPDLSTLQHGSPHTGIAVFDALMAQLPAR